MDKEYIQTFNNFLNTNYIEPQKRTAQPWLLRLTKVLSEGVRFISPKNSLNSYRFDLLQRELSELQRNSQAQTSGVKLELIRAVSPLLRLTHTLNLLSFQGENSKSRYEFAAAYSAPDFMNIYQNFWGTYYFAGHFSGGKVMGTLFSSLVLHKDLVSAPGQNSNGLNLHVTTLSTSNYANNPIQNAHLEFSTGGSVIEATYSPREDSVNVAFTQRIGTKYFGGISGIFAQTDYGIVSLLQGCFRYESNRKPQANNPTTIISGSATLHSHNLFHAADLYVTRKFTPQFSTTAAVSVFPHRSEPSFDIVALSGFDYRQADFEYNSTVSSEGTFSSTISEPFGAHTMIQANSQYNIFTQEFKFGLGFTVALEDRDRIGDM